MDDDYGLGGHGDCVEDDSIQGENDGSDGDVEDSSSSSSSCSCSSSSSSSSGEDDSYDALCRAVGERFDRDEFDRRYATQDRSWRDRLPALPGVLALVDELRRARVPLAIASSSSSGWVESHLERLDLRAHFTVVATSDRVGGRTKPDPASFRWATEQLGVQPLGTVAIEDSRPGIAAALAAGLQTVVVPSEITGHTDLSAAHHRVSSMEELSLARLRAVVADQ